MNNGQVFALGLHQHLKRLTITMNTRMRNELLRGLPLQGIDATRLLLECIEGLGSRASCLARVEMLALVRRVIRAGIAAVEAEECTVNFEQGAWESVKARAARRPTTTRDLRHYVRRMLRVEGAAQLPLRAMGTRHCRRILQEAFGNSVSSYRKGRAILHSIFAYAMRQEWCDTNPVARIEVPPVQEKHIEPLSCDEVVRLQKTVRQKHFRDMRFSLSLLLCCGVRPAEVERLAPEDVCWEEQQLIIRPHKSKTGGGRVVSLRGLGGLHNGQCHIPRNWQNRWRELRRAAGFTRWVPDICRHTFASYHAAYFRNLPELQLEMGHRDATLLHSRYMAPALRREAARFWESWRK